MSQPTRTPSAQEPFALLQRDNLQYGALQGIPLQDITFASNHRQWAPDVAVIPHAESRGDEITVHNVRSFLYRADDEFVVKYYDKSFNIRDLQSVDFIVVPFKNTPSLAHTMLSFELSNGDHLGVSVEARLEADEQYSPIKGALRQFELAYVIADERDLISRRTRHRDVDVFLYKTIATPQQTQELFLDILRRTNQLARKPEFYDTLTNNCTTNIVRHINQLRPGRVRYDLRVLLPGFSDRLAYEQGFLATRQPFEVARREARVNELANRYSDAPDFSQKIRRR